MNDLYPELHGSYVRIAKWVTVEHMARLGFMISVRKEVYEPWRDYTFFQVAYSYMHDDYGRVVALNLVRHSSTRLIWWNGAFVKWCWLELVAESELPPAPSITIGANYAPFASVTSGPAGSYYVTTTYTIS